jgi:hypothetical protein
MIGIPDRADDVIDRFLKRGERGTCEYQEGYRGPRAPRFHRNPHGDTNQQDEIRHCDERVDGRHDHLHGR